MGTRVFLQNKFTDKLISAVGNEFSTEFGTVILFIFLHLKNINNFLIVVLGPRPMTPEDLHFAR